METITGNRGPGDQNPGAQPTDSQSAKYSSAAQTQAAYTLVKTLALDTYQPDCPVQLESIRILKDTVGDRVCLSVTAINQGFKPLAAVFCELGCYDVLNHYLGKQQVTMQDLNAAPGAKFSQGALIQAAYPTARWYSAAVTKAVTADGEISDFAPETVTKLPAPKWLSEVIPPQVLNVARRSEKEKFAFEAIDRYLWRCSCGQLSGRFLCPSCGSNKEQAAELTLGKIHKRVDMRLNGLMEQIEKERDPGKKQDRIRELEALLNALSKVENVPGIPELQARYTQRLRPLTMAIEQKKARRLKLKRRIKRTALLIVILAVLAGAATAAFNFYRSFPSTEQVMKITAAEVQESYPDYTLDTVTYETEKRDSGRHLTITYAGHDPDNGDIISGQVESNFYGSLERQSFRNTELVPDTVTITYGSGPQEGDTFDVTMQACYEGTEDTMTLRNGQITERSGNMTAQSLAYDETLGLESYQETEAGVSGTMPVTLHIVYGNTEFEGTVEAQVTYQLDRAWKVTVLDAVPLEPNVESSIGEDEMKDLLLNRTFQIGDDSFATKFMTVDDRDLTVDSTYTTATLTSSYTWNDGTYHFSGNVTILFDAIDGSWRINSISANKTTALERNTPLTQTEAEDLIRSYVSADDMRVTSMTEDNGLITITADYTVENKLYRVAYTTTAKYKYDIQDGTRSYGEPETEETSRTPLGTVTFNCSYTTSNNAWPADISQAGTGTITVTPNADGTVQMELTFDTMTLKCGGTYDDDLNIATSVTFNEDVYVRYVVPLVSLEVDYTYNYNIHGSVGILDGHAVGTVFFEKVSNGYDFTIDFT